MKTPGFMDFLIATKLENLAINEQFVAGQLFSLCFPVSSTNKTDCQDITEILNTIILPPIGNYFFGNLLEV
jgi:hypothetical protein